MKKSKISYLPTIPKSPEDPVWKHKIVSHIRHYLIFGITVCIGTSK